MVQLMEERVQSEATVAEYKQVHSHYLYMWWVLSCVLQLAQQMDEGHQKQVEELNQELMEVKVKFFHRAKNWDFIVDPSCRMNSQ